MKEHIQRKKKKQAELIFNFIQCTYNSKVLGTFEVDKKASRHKSFATEKSAYKYEIEVKDIEILQVKHNDATNGFLHITFP